MENNPITDAELAELRRLHSAATKGDLQARGFRLSHAANRRIDYDVQHIDEIGQIGTGPYQAIPFARREDAEWHAALHNAFPALIARLEAAERERDRALQDIDNYAQAADQYTADRDAQQRREGAAEWLSGYLQGLSAGNPGALGSMVAILEAELKRLRERGE